MPLQDVLARIPGLAGYSAQQQFNQQADMRNVQQATSLMNLLQHMEQQKALQRKQARDAAYESSQAALPPDATDEQRLAALRPFQDANQQGQQITASQDRRAAVEARIADARMRAQEKLEQIEAAAKEQRITRQEADARSAALRKEMMQMQLEGRRDVAGMMAQVQREGQALRRDALTQGNKPPSGYRLTANGNLEAIPGGPADIKAQQKDQGRQQITDVVDRLAATYDNLEKMGAVVSKDKPAVKNIWERASASGVGQTVAGFVGTKAQAERDQIAASRPLLMAAIKQASGMSSQQLNSNMELQFYLQAATDPTKEISANRAALAVLDQTYGLGAGVRADKDAMDALRKTAPRTAARGAITTGAPSGVDPKVWAAMTPEEKALWK